MADEHKTDSSLDQQLHNASRAARMREERLVQDQTGLSRSQIRKGGLVDALRGDANEFVRRVDDIKHPARHVPQVKSTQQHVRQKEHVRNVPKANGPGSIPIVVNRNGFRETVNFCIL